VNDGSQRIHGFDALRGVLMMLGVVLHTSLSYLPGFWVYTDPWSNAEWIRFVVEYIHLFRMPAFFVLCGFFGALLLDKRGAKAMLWNRFQRIVLPFGVFLFLLYPAMVFSVTLASHVQDGKINPVRSALDEMLLFNFPEVFYHLWFLYHLMYITILFGCGVWFCSKINLSGFRLNNFMGKIYQSSWKSILFFSLLNAIWCFVFQWDTLPTSAGWFPDPTIVSYYFMCYWFGWLMYVSKPDLNAFKNFSILFVVLGMGCLLIRLSLSEQLRAQGSFEWINPPSWNIFFLLGTNLLVGSLALVLTIRGFYGLFLRFADNGTYLWRYISDASYWVYLLHLPIAIAAPVVLTGWDAPLMLKMVVAISLVVFLCFTSYDLMVRSTLIGRFLNGRRYPRYSLGGSTVGSLIGFGMLLFGVLRMPFLQEPILPWLDSKKPPELIPERQMIYPYKPFLEHLKKEIVPFNHCVKIDQFVICMDRTDQAGAQRTCKAIGGSLVVFEQRSLAIEFSEMAWKLTHKPLWIGLTEEREGDWRWSNGVPLYYELWWSGQPDDWGDGEDCALINWYGESKWNDCGCDSNENGFACQLE
jgi:glucans biosynthesis protein C